MSVPSYERKESYLEYVQNSLNLVKYTISRSVKIPKRLTKFISEPLVKTSIDIYSDILYIKNTNTSKDIGTLNERLKHCNTVLGNLDLMLAMLTLFIDNEIENINKINSAAIETWTTIIQKEIKLIHGIKQKIDKQIREHNKE